MPGDRALVNKLAYRFQEPQRGDVIILHSPIEKADYVKRVIGLPGDKVVIGNGIVRVNDMILDEPYLPEPTNYSGEWDVPDGYLFVLGDNRNQSSDSHEWGFLSRSSVVGKAFVVYWPFSEIKILQHHFQILEK